MTGTLRVPRSRGAFSGVLLVLLGVWGGLIPFVGPYVHYAYTPDRAWTLTSGRFWLEILPAVAVVIGGLVVLRSRLRPMVMLGAWLAALGGLWFAVGGALAPLWANALPAQGTAVGGPVARAVEQIGLFTGLGAVIALVAALALGRLSVVAVRDMNAAKHTKVANQATPTTGTPARPVAATSEPASPVATARRPGRLVATTRKPTGAGTEAASAADERAAREAKEPASSGAAQR